MNRGKIACKNCQFYFEGNYCSNCGQKAGEERLSVSNLPKEFIHGFYHLQGGILFTIKELFVNPAEMLRGYISGKRVSHFNPFTFLVVVSLTGGYLYNLSGMLNHINEIRIASDETIKFTGKHLNYRILLTIPTYAIVSHLIYRSYKYNFAEHITINTYLISQSMFFMILWMIACIFIKPSAEVFKVIYYSAFMSLIIYQVSVLFRLFNKGNRFIRGLSAVSTVSLGLSLGFILINYIVKFINMF